MSEDGVTLGKSVVLAAYKYLEQQKNLGSITEMLDSDDIKNMLSGVLEEISKTEELSGSHLKLPSLEEIFNKIKKEDLIDPGDVQKSLCSYTKKAWHVGLLAYHTCRLIAFSIKNKEINDESYSNIIKEMGLRSVIKDICGIDKEIQLITQIAESYEQNEKEETKSKQYVELIKKAYKKGFAYEREFGGCAQCSIAACCETLGKDLEPIFQPATVLSGGCAVCIDGSCGSYSGAAIMIGSYIGRSFSGMLAGSDDDNYARANDLGQKLHKKYIDTYGGVTCQDVQKSVFGKAFLLSDQSELEGFRAAGAHEDRCPSVVAAASAWAVGILHDEGLI